MILDHRGDAVVFARAPLGFWPTEPVAPTSEPTDPAVILATAAGFTIAAPYAPDINE